MPRDGFNFRSWGSISQRKVDFAAEGHFRSPFYSCEMRSGGCEMALVCQRVVSQLWNTLWNGALAAKIGVLKLWGFRNPFRSCEWGGGLRNGTRVPRGCFATAKITKQYIYIYTWGYSTFCSYLITKESYNWWITRRKWGFRHQTSEAKNLKMSDANIWKYSGGFHRRARWLQDFAAKGWFRSHHLMILQPKADFAACEIGLQLSVISFQWL